jgi:cytosine/adenosine deaminase-related metal-dependent hydrolase
MHPALPPVLRNGGVVVTGDRITAVGDLADLRRQFGDLPASRDRLKGLLLPGLINAHTHLELSFLADALQDVHHFPDWVDRLMQATPRDPVELETTIRQAMRTGIRQSLAAGVTTVGDISRHVQFSRAELAADPRLRAVSFGEVVGIGKMRERITPLLDAAMTPAALQAPSSLLTLGISPHAPYTVEGPSLLAAVRRAIMKRAPIAMHLAELHEEDEFLADLAGPLGRDWSVMQRLGILDDLIPRYSGGPIRWAQLWGLIISDARDFPVLLAHVNYCDDAEIAQIAASDASVVYCPRTREFFRHEFPHRYRDMLGDGVNVCLGTDSLASNPDLSVLCEAQRLVQRDKFPAYDALRMITDRAAAALGLISQVGTLEAGKSADLALFPMEMSKSTDTELLEDFVAKAPAAQSAWVAGRKVL